jgi:hypothetical protein
MHDTFSTLINDLGDCGRQETNYSLVYLIVLHTFSYVFDLMKWLNTILLLLLLLLASVPDHDDDDDDNDDDDCTSQVE